MRARFNRQQIASGICATLRSLDRLSRGDMPDYDDWDAIFYSLWYQPAQINLAYTLARQMLRNYTRQINRSGRLQVVDYGCGALAMQFGLALAVADTFEHPPQVALISEDISEPMKTIGWKMWSNFVKEIAKHPELSSLLRVCQEMKSDDQNDPRAFCWLTALHVAYEENADDVKSELDAQVAHWEPDLVLVTTHKVSEDWAYCPPDNGYSDHSEVFSGTNIALRGRFHASTYFRQELCEDYIGDTPDALELLDEDDFWFTRNYLKQLPTNWFTSAISDARRLLYTKDS